jgi:hypothetical protein
LDEVFVICGIIKVEVSVISEVSEPKARLITLTETLIILHIVLNRYRLLIIAGSFADNSVIR